MPKKPAPAFPINFGDGTYMPGMTLRDYFAIHVSTHDLPAPADEMSSVADCADYIGIDPDQWDHTIHYPKVVAKARYAFADAMLEARKQQEGQ